MIAVHFNRVVELSKVNGNWMAHEADREREARYRAEVAQMPNDTYCKNCGKEEAELHDGICCRCDCELNCEPKRMS